MANSVDARYEIHIAEQNGWPIPTPLSDMFKRFSLLGKEGANNDDDDKDDTPIVPLDYEQVFQPDRSSKKGIVVQDSSYHNSTQTSGR